MAAVDWSTTPNELRNRKRAEFTLAPEERAEIKRLAKRHQVSESSIVALAVAELARKTGPAVERLLADHDVERPTRRAKKK